MCLLLNTMASKIVTAVQPFQTTDAQNTAMLLQIWSSTIAAECESHRFSCTDSGFI